MNNKTILLLIGIGLVTTGLVKPNLFQGGSPVNSDALNIPKPSNTELLDECEEVTKCFTNISGSAYDAKRLASLYADIASLIELDGENQVIKNTEEIRQANKLSGLMLKLDIKGKYPDLPKKAESLIIASMGDDNIPLDVNLRKRAVEGFKALAWACNEGAK